MCSENLFIIILEEFQVNKDKRRTNTNTRIVHAGERVEKSTRALVNPVYATNTFAYDTFSNFVEAGLQAYPDDAETEFSYYYTRTSNPTTVAIVEDSRVATMAIKNFMKKKGIEVILDVLSLEGLKAGIDQMDKPDFATMDMILPDGDGSEGCDVLWKKFPELPIIMITGDNISEDVKKKLGPRVKHYMIKPVTGEKIDEAMTSL